MRITIALTEDEKIPGSLLEKSAIDNCPAQIGIETFTEYLPDLSLTGSIPTCETVKKLIAFGILFDHDFAPDADMRFFIHCSTQE
jgi:hypothetical protein